MQLSDVNYSENQIRKTVATAKVEVEVHTHTKGISNNTQLARLSTSLYSSLSSLMDFKQEKCDYLRKVLLPNDGAGNVCLRSFTNPWLHFLLSLARPMLFTFTINFIQTSL